MTYFCPAFTVGDEPVLQEGLTDQTVLSPSTATFTCSLKPGQPTADITWSRAGKPITPDGVKYVATLEGETAKLEILNTTPEDATDVEIKAENKVGMFSSKATLTVHGEISIRTSCMYSGS